MRRVALALIAMFASLLAVSPAQACQLAKDPPPPKLFWPDIPTSVAPDEIVLEIELGRAIALDVPNEGDIVVIDGCGGPMGYVYRIRRVVSGTLGKPEIAILNRFDTGPGNPRHEGIIVGRLLAPLSEMPNFRFSGGDALVHVFQPRSPAG